MKKEELLDIISNVNVDVNSETALQAVELYIQFLYFEKFVHFSVSALFIAFVGWVAYLVFKNITIE
jgi:hypothetical protein